MRRVLGIAVVFLGALVCVLTFSFLLCTTVPGYRNIISSAVASDSAFPTVEVSEGVTVVKDNSDFKLIGKNAGSKKDSVVAKEDNDDAATTSRKAADEYFDNLAKKKAAEDSYDEGDSSFDKELVVVDRTYYEDCGTGEGYWVLTYSDGSKKVE